MNHEATIPSRTIGAPVRELSVRVVEGRDAGAETKVGLGTITLGVAEDNDLVLHDRTVSRYHVELRRDGDKIRLVDLGSTNGTEVGEVIVKDGAVSVRPGVRAKLGNTQIEIQDGQTTILQQAVWPQLGDILGQSEPMQRLMDSIANLASKQTAVLLVGETGTGKELAARALHDLGVRAAEPFVTVDCAAMSPQLFASELFGHERGSFTGANQRHIGAFERANGGTVFLDEIGELPAEQQAALLGVLERRRVRRVGGTEEIPIDIRVISATHRDLRAEVNQGTFRLDLYYRLAVVLVRVPPLRDRRGDLPILISHFLTEEGFRGELASVFDAEQMDRLSKHHWPGNVRELRNVVAATLATGHAELVEGRFGPMDTVEDPMAAVIDEPYKRARRAVTDAFERRYLTRLLERSKSIRAAARLAEIDRTYLSNLLKRHQLR